MLRPTPLHSGCPWFTRSADILRRSDFADIEEIPEPFTPDQARDAHNALIRRLKFPRAVVAAFLLAPLLCSSLHGDVVKKRLGSIRSNEDVVIDVTGGDAPGAEGKRNLGDLAVYRKVKDIWTWTNWNDPSEPDARQAPDDFLAVANSPSAPAIFFHGDEWFGANQYWPNGKLKYDQGYGPGGEMSTNLNFAFTAYAEDGRTPLYRFGATAVRRDPTNETLVSWSDVNPYVRVATTDFIDRRRSDGAARPLPPYLHSVRFSDSYEAEAYRYYAEEDASDAYVPGLCSARRDGNLLERNYDWYRDNAAEFVVLEDAGPGRFASAGVANIGENLTEEFVSSGKWSKYYKCLPGRTVDGVNEKGVAIEVNVVVTNGSDWETHTVGDGRDIDSRWAVRWVLDNAPSAEWAASNLADRVYISKALMRKGYSVHYAIVDKDGTWLVEDGKALQRPPNWPLVVTNFRLDTQPSKIYENDPYGAGYERWEMLSDYSKPITNAWYSNAYRRNADGYFPWPTEFAGSVDEDGPITNVETNRLQAWAKANIPASVPDAAFPRGAGLWQTVHTSVYDISNLTMRVSVQEQDYWYVFQVPYSGAKVDAYTKAEIDQIVSEQDASIGRKFDYSSGYSALYWRQYGNLYLGLMDEEADFEIHYSDIGESVYLRSLLYKANRPVDFDSSRAGNIATLTADGDLADGGKKITDLAPKATTIAGYGITDAKIVNNTVTLGNQSGTFLTAHQSLANYYTKAQTDTQIKNATNAVAKAAKGFADNIAVVGNGFMLGTPYTASGTDGNSFRSIGYGDGVWVAGDHSGNLYRSVTGTNGWSVCSEAVDVQLYARAVRYRDGLWLAAFRSGIVLSSQDGGVTWSSTDLGREIFDICYDPFSAEWFAAVEGGVIRTDFGDHQTLISAATPRQVAVSDEGLVVLGSAEDGSGLWYAMPGETEFHNTNVTSGNFRCLTYANGQFIAGQYGTEGGGTGGIWRSPDGITWEKVDFRSSPYYCCTWADGQWVMTSTYFGRIAYSANGTIWTWCDRPDSINRVIQSCANGNGLTLFCRVTDDGSAGGISVAKIGRYVRSNWFYSKDEVDAKISAADPTFKSEVLKVSPLRSVRLSISSKIPSATDDQAVIYRALIDAIDSAIGN